MSKLERLARIAALGSLPALIALWLFARSAWRVERLYSLAWFPKVAGGLSLASSFFSFSLAEPLLLATAAGAGAVLLSAALERVRGRRTGQVLAGLAWKFSAAAGWILATGYLLWGLNYARPDAVQRLGWQSLLDAKADSAELPRLCRQAIELANAGNKLLEEREAGRQGGPPPLSDRELNRVLDSGFAAAADSLDLEPIFRRRLGPAKPVLASILLSRLGISGFYFPWTGEANFNRSQPRAARIHAIAHEKAHQRGVAGEDEANFFGYLACVLSPDPEVRYSGRLFAQRQLLRQLSLVDPRQARRLADLRSAGVRRDEAEIRAFWSSFEGPASQAGAAVNDSYLRLHGVEGGVESYNLSARLLILLARKQGGLGH